MAKKIIILGAGYAGVEAALTLQRKKRKSDDLEIVLIDKNSYHTLLTELHEVAGNRIDEEGVIVPLRDIFRYTDVKLVKDEINSFDFENNLIASETTQYKYDYLILAAGSEPNFYNIEGLKEHAFTLWSYNDAIRIREHIKECFVKASQTDDSEKRRSLLTFVVGGGGFTGVEMIGELAQWVRVLCSEYDIPRDEVRLVLVEALDKILTHLKERGIQKSLDYLTRKLKVEVRTNSPVTKVTADSVELKDGTEISTKTLIWTAGVKACGITNGMNLDKNGNCRIVVNEYAQTQYPNVYAAGDISAFQTEHGTLPALVESALQTGHGAALNILAEIRGQEKRKITPKLHGVMVSVGSTFAVTNIMGMQLIRPLAVLMKFFVNIHYLFGIGGFELVIKYIKHELLHKRHRRTLPEKHLTELTPTFWLVPLRLFLGYSWLMEGIKKVQDNWLTKAILAGRATDAQTSASVSESGEAVFRLVYDHTPQWYEWIVDNIIVPNALFFQIMIVLAEIGLGLAFITGTFTFIAGLGALALNVNFILSTGLYPEQWWYIPAAICMLAGAGRAFGVDHYLMPYLMRQWRYFNRRRRIKLFLFK